MIFLTNIYNRLFGSYNRKCQDCKKLIDLNGAYVGGLDGLRHMECAYPPNKKYRYDLGY